MATHQKYICSFVTRSASIRDAIQPDSIYFAHRFAWPYNLVHFTHTLANKQYVFTYQLKQLAAVLWTEHASENPIFLPFA